jgi:hypothetical protein
MARDGPCRERPKGWRRVGIARGSSVEIVRSAARPAGRDAASRPPGATKRPSSAASRFSRSLRAEAGSISELPEDMQAVAEGSSAMSQRWRRAGVSASFISVSAATPREAASPLASARARISPATIPARRGSSTCACENLDEIAQQGGLAGRFRLGQRRRQMAERDAESRRLAGAASPGSSTT